MLLIHTTRVGANRTRFGERTRFGCWLNWFGFEDEVSRVWARKGEGMPSRASDSSGIPRVILPVSPAFEDRIRKRRIRLKLGCFDRTQGAGSSSKSGREVQAVFAIWSMGLDDFRKDGCSFRSRASKLASSKDE